MTALHAQALAGPLDLVQELETRRSREGRFLIIRHARRDSLAGLDRGERDNVPLTAEGRHEAAMLGGWLAPVATILTSPVPRCVETAELLAVGAGMGSQAVLVRRELAGNLRGDEETYAAWKARLGWKGLMTAWLAGTVPAAVVRPAGEVAALIAGSLIGVGPTGGLSVGVTHDFHCIAMAFALRSVRAVEVPYLGGLLVGTDELGPLARRKG